MNKFYFRIIVPTILSILLFILSIFFIILPRFQQNIMNGKREMIKELTNSAWSILAKYENDERKGLLTQEDAKKTAASRIQYLRYGEENKDYFWITDMTPIMIMHPFRPDLNGEDLTNFKDPHGKRLFVEFVNTVKKSDHGYVDYMWQWKDDAKKIVPKLSYVKLFKPWGWIIGTGVYIEDVKKEINALTKRLLWISTGITFLLAFLLFFISQQSLKIERKRIAAEKNLNESKEKYRTLVEAATEGLIMLTDGKISFANNIISQMTGFDAEELINMSISEILSENNSKDILKMFSSKIIDESQFEINLKKKTGGFIETIITSTSAVFNDQSVNIIIVKDISLDKTFNIYGLDYQKLISAMNVGLFRASLASKGKFIFANETAVRILGFRNFKELSEAHIIGLMEDINDRKNLRDIIAKNGYIKNRILKIRKKNNETVYVSVTLVALTNDITKGFICDGIIDDITLQENEKSETDKLIIQLKSRNFMIEQSIHEYTEPLCTLQMEATIDDVMKVFQKKNTDHVLLTKNNKEYLGIITNSDIQKRVLAFSLLTDNPAYLIMSSPIVYLSENASVYEAILLAEERKINHLVLRSDTGEVSGVFKLNEIYIKLKNSLTFIYNDIEQAETSEELKRCYKEMLMLVKPLISSDISVSYITHITSLFSDAVISRIINLAISELGPAPAKFSFICLGSEGRREETLYTDQDNAIIYENVTKDKEAIVNEYFSKLAGQICDTLDYIGYSYCQGNIMAKNSQWCQPIAVWEQYFANWINTPEPQNLLDATIFFDFRNIYGEESLTSQLYEVIQALIKQRAVFLYHLAHNAFNTRLSQITSDLLNLKVAIAPIVMFARIYCLQNNINTTNTAERLLILKAKNIIKEATIDEIIYVYNYLMKLRFKNQHYLLGKDLPLSNQLNTKGLIEIELFTLKKILTLIPNYQNMLSVDFRLAT